MKERFAPGADAETNSSRVRGSRAAGRFLLLLCLTCPSASRAGWLITCSCVTADHYTPVVDVRVTVYPDSIAVQSDAQGDFLIPWSGRRGYLTLIPATKQADGTDWCKRIALFPREKTTADSTFDVGQTVVVSTSRLSVTPWTQRPPGMNAPRLLKVPGPAPGQPDSCSTLIHWQTDLWGRVVSVEQTRGDAGPPQVLEAIFEWVRSIPFRVNLETRCESAEPFSGSEEFFYAWTDSGWVHLPLRRTPLMR